MPNLATILSQAFNGLALGSLLALVASGLTIVLGTLGVLNFAHGALFMLGAYATFFMVAHGIDYVPAVALACVAMAALGLLLEWGLIRRFYHRPHEDQILVTFGIGIVLVEAVRALFGGNSQGLAVPGWGEGVTEIGFLFYPTYRLQLIGIIGALLLAFYLVLYRTSLGLVVRAGIENTTMVGILGINVRRTFLTVFALGVMAAGLAGGLDAPIVAVNPEMGAAFMVQSFVVIVIGGLGSFPGAVLGGLIAGEIISLTTAFDAAYSDVMLYAVMAVLLVVRPQGLFGTEGRV